MSNFRIWLIVVIAIMAGSFGIVRVQSAAQQANEERTKAQIELTLVEFATECGSSDALRQHFRAVIQDGETRSDWAHSDHMGSVCAAFAIAAGETLNDALDDEEVSYTGIK